MNGIHQELARRQAAENRNRITEQVGRDVQRLIAEVQEMRRQRDALQIKMDRTAKYSQKWWRLLQQMDIVHRDILAAGEVLVEYKTQVQTILKTSGYRFAEVPL